MAGFYFAGRIIRKSRLKYVAWLSVGKKLLLYINHESLVVVGNKTLSHSISSFFLQSINFTALAFSHHRNIKNKDTRINRVSNYRVEELSTSI